MNYLTFSFFKMKFIGCNTEEVEVCQYHNEKLMKLRLFFINQDKKISMETTFCEYYLHDNYSHGQIDIKIDEFPNDIEFKANDKFENEYDIDFTAKEIKCDLFNHYFDRYCDDILILFPRYEIKSIRKFYFRNIKYGYYYHDNLNEYRIDEMNIYSFHGMIFEM